MKNANTTTTAAATAPAHNAIPFGAGQQTAHLPGLAQCAAK